nr:MAG TPA: hypothetical protein [Caudoviricetes sp.]
MFKKIAFTTKLVLAGLFNFVFTWYLWPIEIAYIIRHWNDPDNARKSVEFVYKLTNEYSLIGILLGRKYMEKMHIIIETTDFSK